MVRVAKEGRGEAGEHARKEERRVSQHSTTWQQHSLATPSALTCLSLLPFSLSLSLLLLPHEQPLRDPRQNSRLPPPLSHSSLRPLHGVSLSRPGLPVSQNRAVVPGEGVLHQRGGNLLEDVGLFAPGGEDAVEGELGDALVAGLGGVGEIDGGGRGRCLDADFARVLNLVGVLGTEPAVHFHAGHAAPGRWRRVWRLERAARADTLQRSVGPQKFRKEEGPRRGSERLGSRRREGGRERAGCERFFARRKGRPGCS